VLDFDHQVLSLSISVCRQDTTGKGFLFSEFIIKGHVA
jgi:hypothetical protein